MTYLNTYVYGEPQYLPIDENHEIAPNTPYHHSKMLAEDACRFYNCYMGLDITFLRMFKVFGPEESNKFLIPQLIIDVLDPQKKVIEVNNLAPKRDYIYIDDLVNISKAQELIDEIKNSNLKEAEKEFLYKSAYRHYIFDYSKIAEYYAHADKEMQELMEKSALVIIDFDDAIKNGYTRLASQIEEMRQEDYYE